MDDCIFCKIIQGKIPCEKIYEDDKYIAFLDITPVSDGHTLVVPKKHNETFFELNEKEVEELYKTVQKVAKIIKSKIKPNGIRITQNNGKGAGQIINHIHVHIMPANSVDEIYSGSKKMTAEQLKKIGDKLRGV